MGCCCPFLGVAFRVRDIQNMYVVEMDRSNEGSKRLVRVYKGLATVLCERHDGGYVPDIWYEIHVDTSHGRIRVCIGESESEFADGHIRWCMLLGEEGTELQQVFDVQDETFVSCAILISSCIGFDVILITQMSGAIGLFSSETTPKIPVDWDEMKVESKDCTPQGCYTSHPPPPPECNTMTYAYDDQ